jgi:hypothetical protein
VDNYTSGTEVPKFLRLTGGQVDRAFLRLSRTSSVVGTPPTGILISDAHVNGPDDLGDTGGTSME